MICVDTTFLIDLWREGRSGGAGARRLLLDHPGQEFAVPAHAAGEFLEGGATVSADRLEQSLDLLRLFRVGYVDLETARHYALIVSRLRAAGRLQGRSKPDLWIAAWAVHHAAPLATRNLRHFEDVPGLELIDY
jgi:predicted nucleic acid-binding protein